MKSNQIESWNEHGHKWNINETKSNKIVKWTWSQMRRKWNIIEMKSNEIMVTNEKRNETKSNEIKWNEQGHKWKGNEI